ncbi:MAG: hypothetical protein OXN21_02210, partial [Chloroflexota bacterium]|nr:hypothetical protein [Chloroflexota bacterium]
MVTYSLFKNGDGIAGQQQNAGQLKRIPITVPGQGIRGYWKVFCGMKLCEEVAKYDELNLAPLARRIIDSDRRMSGTGPLSF